MSDTPESKPQQDIDRKLSAVEVGSLRYQALQSVKKYKSSWVELGEALREIGEHHSYREWGFTSLEAYGANELHIRKETLYKMIANYHFLRQHEPTLLKEERRRDIPDFHTVSVLNEAKKREDVPDDMYHQLRNDALEKAVSAMKLKRQLPKDETAPSAPRKANMRQLHTKAVALKNSLLQYDELPDSIVKSIEAIVSYTEKAGSSSQELQVKRVTF